MARTSRIAAVGAACFFVAVILWRWAFPANTSSAPLRGVPVRVARAARSDAPAYLSNIATVQAFNSVLVRARVDGQITRVVFDEGAEVKKGDVLVELDRRPYEAQWRAALAQKARDSAQLDNARRDLRRYQTLIDADAGAVQTLDTTRAQVAQLAAAVDMDQAQIDLARLQLTYTAITAPIDGRTGARLVDVGNIVHASDANGLVVLTQIQPIAVTFSLPQNTLPTVRAQQGHHLLRVLAMAARGDQALGEGQLTLIDNQIDASTGTFRCKAVFPNPAETLWPGEFVTVRLMLEALPNAVMIPNVAVQAGPHGSYVYVVGHDQTAELRAVQVGQVLAEETVILGGLKGGEQVIVDGLFRLEPGAPLDITNPVATAATR